jgi:peptide chain release factor 1
MDLKSLNSKLSNRIAELEKKLSDGSGNLAKDSQELANLKQKKQTIDHVSHLQNKITENETITDPELKELVKIENEKLETELKETQKSVMLLLFSDPMDERNAIVEIHAGTGGDEAGLFAEDLMRMYLRYAELKNLKTQVLDMKKTSLGGIKEAEILISGPSAYGILKFESGVHRVQRIPTTEKKGRVQTSAAGVVVLPEAEVVDMTIKPEDLRIDVYRSSGPGGQSVNTTDSAVRITHLPTNTVVTCQDEKSQLKNKEKAMKILRSRLLALELAKKAAEDQKERKSMVQTLDRSEKIRTYNFPQNRMTDHRINFTSHNLDKILAGELDELTSALREAEIQNKLEELDTRI